MNARFSRRATVVAGTVATTGAVALMALVSGTATAAPDATTPGRCTDNVNVRSDPDKTADIVAVCERGQTVQVGETRGGFVHLVNLDGWSAAEYIATSGAAPAAGPQDEPATGDAPAADPTQDEVPTPATDDETGTDTPAAKPAPANTPPRAPGLGALTGLLGGG